MSSAGFPYRLGRLKPRASTSRGPLAKVHNIFVIVIDLSYTCCHKPSVIFLALKANKSTLALISVLFLSFNKSSEIDKLKKQGVVRHQICFNVVVNFL